MEPPVPRALPSIVLENHVFSRPEKAIKTMRDMGLWEKSGAYNELINFILILNEKIRGKSLSATCEISDNIKCLLELLDKLQKLIEANPPIEQAMRFGNKAFRNWFETLKNTSSVLLEEAIPKEYHAAIPEICIYFEESFGNPTRIDYGTGHEAAFVMFLYCLYKIKLLQVSDMEATVCLVFYKYLELARNLQQTYKMEPAGSHGVWSLDDFQFIPFIWGSSQLLGHSIIEPSKFLDDNILDKYGKDFMFLSCIQYIQRVKTGPFAEHSNQLWGISAVSSWNKINQGLIKMYTKEVLGKFPVVQHMLFGSLLTIKPGNITNKSSI